MHLNLERDVLAPLQQQGHDEAARTLVTHPRNDLLMLEGGCYFYLDRAQGDGGKLLPMSGLTKLLKEFYWPSWSLQLKSKSSNARVIKRMLAQQKAVTKTKKDKKKWKTAQEAAHSHVRGSIVHRQLNDWILHDMEHFKKRNPENAHPMLLVALRAFRKRKVMPLAVEYRVACEAIGLATAIDLVCVDMTNGRVCFVEVKTTRSRALFHLDDPAIPFASPLLKGLQRSDATRAKVQLAMGVLMAVEGLGWTADFDAYVLLLTEGVAEPDWIEVTPKFLENVGVPIYKDMKKRVPKWRADKAAAKKTKRTATDDLEGPAAKRAKFTTH